MESLQFGKRYENGADYLKNPLVFSYLKLYAVRELFCEAGYEVPPDDPSLFRVHYVAAGRVNTRYNHVAAGLACGCLPPCFNWTKRREKR